MQSDSPPPPYAFQPYYLPLNFIIDTGEHIYFYQQSILHGWFCGTGLPDTIPPFFIDLQPKDIVEVPIDNVEQFIKLNIRHLSEEDRLFTIASTIDTITSTGLAEIFFVFKDTANHIKWTFRKTTQEETVVLKYKKSRERYEADAIKWDSARTLFRQPASITKFTPPRILY